MITAVIMHFFISCVSTADKLHYLLARVCVMHTGWIRNKKETFHFIYIFTPKIFDRHIRKITHERNSKTTKETKMHTN